MDTFSLTLSTLHVVTLKKGLTYRAERAITATLMGDTPLKVTTAKTDSIREQELELRYSNIQAYQDEALRHLLVSVLNPDKSEAEDPFNAVMELPAEVAQEVMDTVSDLTKSKKKSKTSS